MSTVNFSRKSVMHSNVSRGQDCVSETHVSLILKVDADNYSTRFLKGLKLMDIIKVIVQISVWVLPLGLLQRDLWASHNVMALG